jgi:site-specific DNA-methyltransferase (adenine-specific)
VKLYERFSGLDNKFRAQQIGWATLIQAECLEAMKHLPTGSVDMVLCDLPYGTTACAWDSLIDLKALWSEYKRVLKPYRAIVLTASQPFTTTLAASNLEWLKYEWIWMKNRPTNFAHAKNKPMKKHENVLVFSEGTTVHATQSDKRMPYFPQGVQEMAPKLMKKSRRVNPLDTFFSERKSHGDYVQDKTGYPHSILEFSTENKNWHQTAKPVALMEYLIRTYTERGQVVLDNTMGSGTTGVACINTGRRFIGIEREPNYFEVACSRVADADEL